MKKTMTSILSIAMFATLLPLSAHAGAGVVVLTTTGLLLEMKRNPCRDYGYLVGDAIAVLQKRAQASEQLNSGIISIQKEIKGETGEDVSPEEALHLLATSQNPEKI